MFFYRALQKVIIGIGQGDLVLISFKYNKHIIVACPTNWSMQDILRRRPFVVPEYIDQVNKSSANSDWTEGHRRPFVAAETIALLGVLYVVFIL